MDKPVYAAKVDEHAIRGDVLDSSFENLTFLQFADDFFLLCFKLSFDKRFM